MHNSMAVAQPPSRPPMRCPWKWVVALPVVLGAVGLLIALASPITEFLYIPIFFGTMALAVLLFAAGLVWSITLVALKRRPRLALGFVAAGILIAGTQILGVAVVSSQATSNEVRAAPLIQAIEQYHRDTGAYPSQLSDLKPKYLAKLPSCRYGMFSWDFAYQNGSSGEPFVKYMSSPGLCGRYYYFHRGIWKTDCG